MSGSMALLLSLSLGGSILALLVLVPLTLLGGTVLFQGRRYFFLSLLLLFEALAPMALSFEASGPGPRRLVVLAVLTALAAAGRAAFFMLPQFKPMAAVAILAGAAFGGQAGFLVGAASMLVSNFFFVQGVWTPWQMAAMGLLGLLAGRSDPASQAYILREYRRLSRTAAGLARAGTDEMRDKAAFYISLCEQVGRYLTDGERMEETE